ncbi:hypothetical protein [Candidatus Burkholderia verschuerenii]|uniref:hypothetical protein n=1 Tax=Candidatus Burkholderia verschuerenii TaxID=242163 RepID=UPI001E588A54|nr:hypothetical protein [Candidatus Burkholderia verschuerenii]
MTRENQPRGVGMKRGGHHRVDQRFVRATAANVFVEPVFPCGIEARNRAHSNLARMTKRRERQAISRSWKHKSVRITTARMKKRAARTMLPKTRASLVMRVRSE